MTDLDPDRSRDRARAPVEDDPDGVHLGVARAMASSPIIWRGAVAAVGCVALLTARAGVTGLFDEIVGLTMIAIAVLEHTPRVLGGQGAPWWRSGVLVLTGILIFLWPSGPRSRRGRSQRSRSRRTASPSRSRRWRPQRGTGDVIAWPAAS